MSAGPPRMAADVTSAPVTKYSFLRNCDVLRSGAQELRGQIERRPQPDSSISRHQYRDLWGIWPHGALF